MNNDKNLGDGTLAFTAWSAAAPTGLDCVTVAVGEVTYSLITWMLIDSIGPILFWVS